ncbi:MAG: ATP-binding protein [Lentimicrobiaceae bacterium]|nr:ATP-binding protein [Lentimicrobiaceae bacterium]MDD4597039.1 ATP-binding protein [Lentimicrobiaceae bacterium]MDY0024800.1 ATP-binding protein [Lentimicrobium sp.]
MNRTDSLRMQLETTADPVYRASLLQQLSRNAMSIHAFSDAADYLTREADERKAAGDSIGWANAHYTLGMVYSRLRNFDRAILNSLTALDYFHRNRMFSEAANAAINLGVIYHEKRQTELSLDYFLRALNIIENLSSRDDLEASYLNLGTIDDTHVNGNLNAGTTAVQSVINKHSLLLIYTTLGELYKEKNEILQAEKFLFLALNLSREVKNEQYEATALIQLGEVFFESGKRVEAYKSIEGGLAIARSSNLMDLVLSAYSKLARITMALKQPAIAFTYLEQYIELQDSLYNDQQLKLLNQSQENYRMYERSESEYLLRENLEQSLKLEQNTNTKMALIALSVFVIILLIIIVLQQLHKTKSKANSAQSNTLSESEKSELEKLIETKDRFLSIIAHDLKNPFTSLLGFVDLAYTEFDEISDAEKRSYLGIIRQSSQHIYALLENLLTWSRAQSGRIEFNPQPVDIAEIVESSIEVVRSSADNKQLSLYTDIPGKITVIADKNMLFTIMRNLLSNAIKFTPNGGSVTVSCRVKETSAYVSVTDTGVGMTEDELSRLFRIDGNLKNSGTNSETGTGLGLILCQEFMNIHKSVITAESTPGKGSTFTFSLNLAKSSK